MAKIFIKLKKTAQAVGLLLFGIILSLSLLEIAIRLLNLEGDYFYRFDRRFGWSFVPNKKGLFINRTYGIKNRIQINSKGLRDSEHTYLKEEGTSRILVLGDSYAEAFQVELKDTFYKILQRELNKNGKSNWEVINAGVGGYGTDNELLFYSHEGYQYEPDIVILAFTMGNDVLNNGYLLKIEADKPYFVLESQNLKLKNFPIPKPGITKNLKYFLANHSKLFLMTANLLVRQRSIVNLLSKLKLLRDPTSYNEGIPTAYFVYASQYPDGWKEAWDITKALIIKLNDEVKRHRARLVVVLMPGQEQYYDESHMKRLFETYPAMKKQKWEMDKPDRILVSFLEEQKIDYVHLLPIFKTHTEKSGFVPHDHFNVEEHRLIGKTICNFLSEKL